MGAAVFRTKLLTSRAGLVGRGARGGAANPRAVAALDELLRRLRRQVEATAPPLGPLLEYLHDHDAEHLSLRHHGHPTAAAGQADAWLEFNEESLATAPPQQQFQQYLHRQQQHQQQQLPAPLDAEDEALVHRRAKKWLDDIATRWRDQPCTTARANPPTPPTPLTPTPRSSGLFVI